MKKSLLTLLITIVSITSIIAQNNIAEAHAMGEGSTVTVTGIVTNGDELGLIRYIQDTTGGLAIYSSAMTETKRGDEVTVTGQLVDYNTLLEMNPVTSVTINSSGNPLPDPIVLTPDQMTEEYEGMLVRVNNVEFDASGTFERKSYTYQADGEAGQIYINDAGSPLIGTVIPTNPIALIGPLGQYQNTYQVLPRDQFDLLSSSVINLTSVPEMSDLTTSGFFINWSTDVTGSTEAFYGNTPEMESGIKQGAGNTLDHMIRISSLQPSEIIYVQPFSVKDNDTAKAAVQVYITQSESSGDVKTYFNKPVDNSVSLGLMEAVYLDHAIDDTLIKYIDRAEESIDFTIYNFNNSGISNITNALNNAYDRGVVIRVIYDSNIDAVGVESLNGAIGKIASPKSEYPVYGIMHNKFVVFDANSSDPDKPVVWTGSTNFTDGQINTDANNVVVIQDQSLAKAYQLEFNEMYGSSGTQPDAGNSRFGSFKKDDTPHEFIINDKQVECYFSPSDGTHSKILETIGTGDYSIHIATMLITKTDIGYDLADKNDIGVDVKVLLNDYDQYGEPIVNTLKTSLGEDIRLKGETGIMHNKYMIVDQAKADSDPLVLTGSHNWSSSAQFRNDENTLIIHDQGVANAYYQDFVKRFSYGQIIVPKPECENEFVTMYGGAYFQYDVLFNDYLPSGGVTVTINREPSHGTAQVEADQTIKYIPDPGFNQDIDTIGYKVCMESSAGICDSALMVIYVNKPEFIDNTGIEDNISVYPNPASGELYISYSADLIIDEIEIIDQTGRTMSHIHPTSNNRLKLTVSNYQPGLYILKIYSTGEYVHKKVFVK